MLYSGVLETTENYQHSLYRSTHARLIHSIPPPSPSSDLLNLKLPSSVASSSIYCCRRACAVRPAVPLPLKPELWVFWARDSCSRQVRTYVIQKLLRTSYINTCTTAHACVLPILLDPLFAPSGIFSRTSHFTTSFEVLQRFAVCSGG